MYRKSQEISSPHLKPFSVESRKTSRGTDSPPPPPSPPVIGLTRHRLGYWRTLECLGEGLSRPLLSREPLVVESRARRHSKALHKTHQTHLSEFKIEVTCEVKVRSKVKIQRFDVLGPGDQDYRNWRPKLRQNVVIGMVKGMLWI